MAFTVLAVAAAVAPLVIAPWQTDVFALPKLVALAGLTAVALLAASFAGGWRWSAPLDLPLVAFAGLAVAAWLASPDRATSLSGQFPEYQGLWAVMTYVAAYGVARHRATWDAVGGWVRIAATASLVVAVYAIAQASGIDPLWSGQRFERTFATIGQANSLAAYLTISAGLTVAAAAGKHRTAWMATGVVLALALATTQSRGGLLGLACALLVAVLLIRPRIRPRAPSLRKLAVLATLTVLVAVPLRGVFDGSLSRFASIADGENESIRQHVALWQVAWAATLDAPGLGHGPDLFPAVYTAHAPVALDAEQQLLFRDVRPESPHSVPLAYASGFGLPLLAAYLALVGVTLMRGVRSASRARGPRRVMLAGLVAGATGHFVTDLFMTAEVTSSWMFWVALGIVGALTSPSLEAAAGTDRTR